MGTAGRSALGRIIECASETGGVCRRRDLLDAGVAPSTIDRHVGNHELVRVIRGVYEVPILSGEQTHLYRATMAIPNAVVSRQTAGALHGFPIRAEASVHVTAPRGVNRRVDQVVVHETRVLQPEDVVLVGRDLKATSPARTLLDLAATVSPRLLRHLVTSQAPKKKPSVAEMQACIASLGRHGVGGVAALRRCLDEVAGDGDRIAESELEARVWVELTGRGIEGFRRQFRPPWFDGRRGVVDFADPDHQVILEADGRRWHTAEQAMSEDRRRDRLAIEHGWLPLRVTWQEVVERPDGVFDQLQRIVTQRRL